MSKKKTKNILITGGAGFLGSHLCDKLVNKDNNKVICVDNLSSGTKKNINHLIGNPKFKFVKLDVIDLKNIKVDEIYNLACPASPVYYQIDPIKTINTCVLGAINNLEIAKKYGSKIFHASTSEVYGSPLEHPQNESYWGNVNPHGIRSCYDEGKRCAESLMLNYHRQHNVNIKIARIFNTYGPRMHKEDGRVVSNFIVQALKNKPITVYGRGNQTRSFCYIDDLVSAFVLLMKKNKSFSGPVNLGNPKEYTVLQLAETIKHMTNSKSRIIFKKLPGDDPVKRKPDISMAKKEIKWTPKIKLETGLLKTIDYFEKILSNIKNENS